MSGREYRNKIERSRVALSMWRAPLLLLAACGADAVPSERPTSPHPSRSTGLPGFAASDLVTFADRELTTWKLAAGQLVKLGSVTLPADGDGEWADRDHLFLALEDRRVVMVTAHAITDVPIPPASTFEIPKPAALEGVVPGAGVELSMLSVTEGAAYWSRCAWGEPFGAFLCRSWVHARLWPSPRVLRDRPPLRTRRWTWPAPPVEHEISSAPHAVTCHTPGGTTTIAAGTPDDPDEQIAGAVWVSARPPRLLISYGEDGPVGIAALRWTLHDGCAATPLASGVQASPGPRGMWVGRSRDQPTTIYRGADAIGEVPELAAVWFRPPR